jgi:outer membrane protein OmpA-like peptidoglycan-associated protein/tetratricopeptide (TPR) repeat protein
MKKFFLFISVSLLVFSVFLTGCQTVSMAKAKEAKGRLQYAYAASLFNYIATNSKNKEEKAEAREEAAFCYRMANDYEKAIKAYEKVLKNDKNNTEAMYQLGALKMKIAGDCNKEALKEARDHFTEYLKNVPNDERAQQKIASIDSAESWREDIPKSRYKVTNFKILNTKGMDYSPMIGSKKDDVLYFSTDREGGPSKKRIFGGTNRGFSDIWFTKGKKDKKKKTLKWEKPVIADGSINTKFNDGSCVFDRKYSTIYYTQCNGADGKSKYCKIYSAKLTGTTWSEEQMLGFCVDDTFDYGHPALSEDGKTLYFSSNRPDGMGGYDIWCVTYNQRAKSWGEPFNLGDSINTEKDEMFPYWNDHENALYFSSQGHLGMGGFDIFRSEGSGTEWTAPENLRAPLNSGGDDFGITFDNNNRDHGFFTSNRCEGKGDFDIYEFNIEPLIIEIEGYVYECAKPETNPPGHNVNKPLKNSVITITNDKDSTKIIVKTDDKGYYGKIRLNEKTNYEINCDNRELYYFDAMPVQRTTRGIKNSVVLRQDFCLKSQIIEEVVPIYYDLDKANIRPDAALVLDTRILPLLQKYPKLRLELGSHTDCRSSYDYNIDLSQRRADSAVAYLVRKGVDPRRLMAKGYGESQLVNDCKCEGKVIVPCTEAQHQENRRTTIKTLDVNFDPNVKEVLSGDANNVNSRPIIVKTKKVGANYMIGVSANGADTAQAYITPGADNFVSINELKRLISKGVIKAEDLTGITIADIQAGRLKPNATVKFNTLRFGPKDRAYTATSVTFKINNTGSPYTIGVDGLKALNGTLNPDEGEITFKNINSDALKGGPVDSKIGAGTTGGTGTTGTTTAPAKPDTVSLDDYKRVTMIDNGGGSMSVPTMINDKENINWVYDPTSRKIEITEELAVQLLESGVISKKDFEEGESIKTKDGKKLPSNAFKCTITIGDVVIEDVKVIISNKVDEPTMGGLSPVLKKVGALVKGKILFMKPKEKKK